MQYDRTIKTNASATTGSNDSKLISAGRWREMQHLPVGALGTESSGDAGDGWAPLPEPWRPKI